jgi:hypothetical protein
MGIQEVNVMRARTSALGWLCDQVTGSTARKSRLTGIHLLGDHTHENICAAKGLCFELDVANSSALHRLAATSFPCSFGGSLFTP